MFNKNWWFLNFQKEFFIFIFVICKLAVAFYMINEIQPKIKFQKIVQCPFKFYRCKKKKKNWPLLKKKKKSEFWGIHLVLKLLVSSAFQFLLAAIFCQITQKKYNNIRIRLKIVTISSPQRMQMDTVKWKFFGHLLKIAHMDGGWIWTLYCTCALWMKLKKI